ncbi:MAG TPA: hypothetical protein PKC87_04145 [Candidatus Absconditabacterales bacterium]|nr:hypothetical protein [Candidatus Absconditabacterales bacterium]
MKLKIGIDFQVPTYTILVKVAYFNDTEQTQKAFEEDKTFEKVPYNPSWDGSLATIYGLINS